MDVNIARIVREDVSNRTGQLHVIFEAITNSIQANATTIICRFTSNQLMLEDENGEIVNRKVDSVEIEDDGDGFTDDNYKSFGDYRSDYKAKFGCKGVGRFSFLKVFRSVKYSSWLTDPQGKRWFSFSFDFDKDNALNIETCEVPCRKTVLSLSDVSSEYCLNGQGIDRRLDMDMNSIREKVLTHLIPTLYFCKKQERTVVIEFIDTGTSNKVKIEGADIPEFSTMLFEIRIPSGEKYDFELLHHINHGRSGLKAFYCADMRTVCEFSDTDFKVSLPASYSGYLLVKSSYLDKHIDNERDQFTIYPVKTDVFQPLSWEMINGELRAVVSTLVKQCIPEAVCMNRTRLLEILDERPYLVDYIDENDLDIAGFVDKKQIVDKARKKFLDAKESLLSNAGKEEYTDKDLQDAIQVAENELVSYVQDRVLVIEKLKRMMKDKEKSEKIIHNLFMQKYTTDNYYCARKNNLWLLDDRFTSYCYAASDKHIKNILDGMNLGAGTKYDGDKPDIALFFSHNPEDKDALKSVIIELKSFNDDNKSDRDKFEGVQQLLDYIEAFQDKEEIKEVWAFLVTDIDDKFEDRLVNKNDFTPLFATDRSIYYRYYEKMNAFIYVFGVETLVADAEARNKVFIDMIKKRSRLQQFLQEKEIGS
jgi:hypothetical protein